MEESYEIQSYKLWKKQTLGYVEMLKNDISHLTKDLELTKQQIEFKKQLLELCEKQLISEEKLRNHE
jgi:hypothetical protein